MALTEKGIKEILSEAGCPLETLDGATAKILGGHVTSINALREKADAYKADAEKLVTVQKELDDRKASDTDNANWKSKYEKEHTDFETFKSKTQAEKENANKITLYRTLLKNCGIDGKRLDAIMRVTDVNKIEVKDGKIVDAEKVEKNVREEWADFIMNEKTGGGAPVDDPPANGGDKGKKPESRAAQLAAEYHKEKYGEEK